MIRSMCLLALFLFSIPSFGTGRIEGRFELVQIEDLPQNSYRLLFVSQSDPGLKVMIESSNVHTALLSGKSRTFKILADLAEGQPSKSEASNFEKAIQVAVFLETKEGSSPVWIVSKDMDPSRMSSKNLLKLHAPSNDLQIF